jgi:limonene-1,2-epoxide hydrolase
VVEGIETGALTPEMEDALSFMHPDVAWNAGGFGAARGLKQLAAIWDSIFEIADAYGIVVTEVRDGRNDLVYAAIDRSITAKGSGIQTTFPVFSVTRVSDGVITEIDEYLDRHQALKAAGLAE